MVQDEDTANLRSEIVKHLSSEIVTHSQYLMTFRSRIAFTVLVGPFVVLGYFLVASKPVAINFWGEQQTLACTAVGILYLMLGFYGSRLDQHGTDQCNKWRSAILKISTGKDVDEKDLLIAEKVWWPYVAGYVSVLLVFLAIGWLLLTLIPTASLR